MEALNEQETDHDTIVRHECEICTIQEDLKEVKDVLGKQNEHLDKQDAALAKIQWYVLTAIISIMGTIIAFKIIAL